MRSVSWSATLNTSLRSGVLLCFCALLWSGQVSAALQLEGQMTQGGLIIGSGVPGAEVWLDDQPVPVNAAGVFVVGLARESAPVLQLKVQYADGRKEQKTLSVSQREFKIQRIDGLPKRKVTPTAKADLKRIRDDAKRVRAARAKFNDREDFRSDFIWPVEGRISGVYGSQRVLNGKPKRPHFGVDVARPTGTLVRAPADGVVVLAAQDLFYSGGTLIIDHGMHMNTSYLHLNKVLVSEGQTVQQGDVIGHVGKTGRATGPHLHWGANVGGVRIDPALLVPPMPTKTAKAPR